jgi:hypothetical protein
MPIPVPRAIQSYTSEYAHIILEMFREMWGVLGTIVG